MFLPGSCSGLASTDLLSARGRRHDTAPRANGSRPDDGCSPWSSARTRRTERHGYPPHALPLDRLLRPARAEFRLAPCHPRLGAASRQRRTRHDRMPVIYLTTHDAQVGIRTTGARLPVSDGFQPTRLQRPRRWRGQGCPRSPGGWRTQSSRTDIPGLVHDQENLPGQIAPHIPGTPATSSIHQNGSHVSVPSNSSITGMASVATSTNLSTK